MTTLSTTAAITWLNPHVYLDTVVLLGTVGAQQPVADRATFVAGAGAASLMWFAALGYGASAVAPWLARPATWRVIDASVKTRMKEILDEIQTGRFTKEWMLECASGQSSFKALRRRGAKHSVEEVGQRLRGMMPWISASALVDKTKN